MGVITDSSFSPVNFFFLNQVSALGLDPSGARLVTGGYDYDVKFWDFAGMDASFKAFRSLQPCEWYVSLNLIPTHLKTVLLSFEFHL